MIVGDGNGLGGSTKIHGGIHCAGVPVYIGGARYTTSESSVLLWECRESADINFVAVL
jgi:hypothetical protein